MKKAAHSSSNLYFMVLAVLFSGLLLSTAVLPTVMSVSYGKAIAAPVPVEEEQMHGRDVQKSPLHDHSAWGGSALSMRERIRATFRDRDEMVPDGPISDVRLQPPKGV